MPNLKDVAKKAGVSIATVSRVLNNPGSVRPETRLRVQKAIRELRFQPSRVARRLRTKDGGSKLMGLVIPDIRNPFYVDVLRGVEDVAYANDYAVLMTNFAQNAEKEKLYLEIMRSESVDGMIVAPANQHDKAVLAVLEGGTPVVCIDRVLLDVDVDAVVVDNRRGARQAIDFLTGLGHRRIAYISGPYDIPTYRERLEGYQEALSSAGIPFDECLVKVGDSSHESGRILTEELLKLKDPPTAIFAGNNLITLGTLEILHQNKLRIPEDISVIGFDDMYWAISLNPPLTAVSQPGYEIGRRAAELLYQKIADPQRMPVRIVLNTELKIRKSCAPRGAQE